MTQTNINIRIDSEVKKKFADFAQSSNKDLTGLIIQSVNDHIKAIESNNVVKELLKERAQLLAGDLIIQITDCINKSDFDKNQLISDIVTIIIDRTNKVTNEV